MPDPHVISALADKWSKTHAHRAERVAARIAMAVGDDGPHPKAFGDPWKAEKDGKSYFGDGQPEIIRK